MMIILQIQDAVYSILKHKVISVTKIFYNY